MQFLRRFALEPFVRKENVEEVFSEMCFFHDGMIIHSLFQTPLTEPDHLIRITARRFLRALVKPEYLEEAFGYLDSTV